MIMLLVLMTWMPQHHTLIANAATINFTRKTILTPSTPGASQFNQPTTLALGPDNRLYIGQQNGRIFALTLDANRNVTAVQVINTIYNTPNKNDDGTAAPEVVGRTELGIVFDPASTAAQPIMYVTHSDPRIGTNNSTTAKKIDTYSGMITKLIGPDYDSSGKRVDLITELPRSRENHGTNGIAWGPDGWLYVTQGGNTNNGAPSTYFSDLPERYLTAAVLRANVKSANFKPLSVRNIDKKSAEKPGIFEIFASGYRNAYDLVWHSNGKLYVIDNGSNAGLGTTPGPADGCANTQALDLVTQMDHLHLVTQGAYGGHPNPARGECVFDDGTVYSPDIAPQANYTPPLVKLDANGKSTDGMAEYRAATFDGQMVGNLIAATWGGDHNLRRIVLSADGNSVTSVSTLGAFTQPLDVIADSDGVIYVADHGADAVILMLPNPPLTGVWATKAPLPTAASELGVVEAGGKIYTIGGLTSSGRTNNVKVYNPSTDTWSSVASYPGPALDHVGAASVNGKVYLVGGMTKWPDQSVNTVYVYDPATNAWTQKANLPSPRGAMGVGVINGKIYAAGGLSGGVAVKDLTVYDPATNAWSSLAAMPTARDHLIAEGVGGKLYAIGGRNKDISSYTGANEVYDPSTNTWSTAAAMPTPRGGQGSAVLNGRILVFGGEGNNASTSGTFPNNEEYNPLTNTWRSLAAMPTPRHGTDGATYSDIVFVPGGGPTEAASQTTVHEAFTLTDFIVDGGCPKPNSDPKITDSDNDAYTDQDELDNNTDLCNQSSYPPDFDGDRISDVNDPDDDNDGIPDTQDQLFFDAANGTQTALPLAFEWNPGDPPLGALANTGFTGAQISSSGPRFTSENISVGAAGGYMSITTSAGTNSGSTNSQENALQLGFDATQPFRVTARVTQPFLGKTPAGQQAGGIFLGLDQDTYVKLVVSANNGSGTPGIQFAVETGGTLVANPTDANPALTLPGPSNIDLFLDGDPQAKTIKAYYRVDSSDPAAIQLIGTLDATAYPALAGFFKNGLPAGLLATHAGTTTDLTFAFDFFRISYTNPAGLTGQYYDNQDLTNLKLTRIDPTVNFNWADGSPDPLIGADSFSVRWTGQFKADKSETYTFWTTSNDGVRLWVNNQQLINNWTAHSTTENSGAIALQAGQSYPITLEYYEGTGTSVISLSYSSPSTAKQIIPSSRLVPVTPPADTNPPLISAVQAGAIGTTGATISWNTDEPADSQVEYGTSTSYGSSTTLDPALVMSHSVPLSGLTANTTYHYRVMSKDAAGNSAVSGDFTFTTTAASSFTPIRVNAGGSAFTDGQGQVWAADTGFSGGSTNSTTSAIAGTNDDKLYQSERYGTFSYAFPVPNGSYRVTLKFAEIYWTSAGQRVFNVAIEGTTVLSNFDILKEVAAKTALDKPFEGTISDGTLNITFSKVVNNPKISAIEIVSLNTADTTPPTVVSVSPVSGATGVAVTSSVAATFSEAIDPATLTNATFTLVKQGQTTPVNATVSYDSASKTGRLVPAASLEAGVSYVATVKGGASGVKDSAGNPLATDKVWSFATASNSTPTTVTFSPAADAYVSSTAASSSYGTLTYLLAQGNGGVSTNRTRQIFIRFTVSGLPAGASVSVAKLRLYVNDASPNGGIFNRISNTTWAESITWNTKPAIDGPQLADLGPAALNTWVEVDVTSVVTGNGAYSFSISLPSANTDPLGFVARESGTVANRPQLVVTSQ